MAALLDASSSLSQSSSAIDAEETVALQNLLQVSQQADVSSDSSMSISRDSDTTESRRATLGLGEVQARLMQELNDFERRSSVLTRPLSRASQTSQTSQGFTDTRAGGGLLELLETEQDSTLELQQYAEALRQQRAEAVNAEASEATEATDEILRRMRLSTSAAHVEAFDATVTEDLRRLSQLLGPTGESSQGPSQGPSQESSQEPSQEAAVDEDSLQGSDEQSHAPLRFSPLLTRSGSKQVIHSVKSNQKYARDAEEQLRVIRSVTPRRLFQDLPDAASDVQTADGANDMQAVQAVQGTQGTHVGTESGVPETGHTTDAGMPEPLQEKEVETSLNLDQFFLPSKTQSSLEASSIVSASLPLTSSESMSMDHSDIAKPDTDHIPHTPTIPEPALSPIRPPSSTVKESSLSPIDPPASRIKEPSLSPVSSGRFTHQ